jgi:hypothetical protein
MFVWKHTNLNNVVPGTETDGILHVVTGSKDRSLRLFKVNLIQFCLFCTDGVYEYLGSTRNKLFLAIALDSEDTLPAILIGQLIHLARYPSTYNYKVYFA